MIYCELASPNLSDPVTFPDIILRTVSSYDKADVRNYYGAASNKL